ncbi:hypothetical protein AB0L57_15960 [Nocardia sp. NPDC052254]|uniref:hypothetical protein n=1 Tax=Nocardia sp. NPDC052254 TaxID=3155681 RepID=UPI00343064DA
MSAKKIDEPEDRAEALESAEPETARAAAGDVSGTAAAAPGSESAADSEEATRSDTAAESGNSTGADGVTAGESTKEYAVQEVSVLSRLASKAGGRGVAVALRAVAAVVLGAAVGSSIYFYTQDKDHSDVLTAQAEARQAACAYGPVVSTYDAKHLDQYVHDVLAGATGDWRKQFESNSKDLSDVLAKGEVVAKSTDVQCAIRSGDKNSAEAIVVIGQTITSLGTQGKPEPGQLSTVMRLEKQGDHWLVGKISTPLAPLPPQS